MEFADGIDEVAARFDVAAFAGFKDGGQDGGGMGAGYGGSKEAVFAAQGNGSHAAFDGVVVERDAWVIKKGKQAGP